MAQSWSVPVFTRCVLLLTSSLLLAGCSSAPDKPAAMRELPACGALPNCVKTQSGSGLQASMPLKANAEQWQALKAWIARQEGWDISIEDGNFIQVVVKTPVMGFRDDVQLLFLPDLRLIHVRSSSRLGLSGLGTNARRVETLREQLAP